MSLYGFMGKYEDAEVWLPHSKESVKAYLEVLRDAGQREADKHKEMMK